jgi:hypothetical protein
MDLSLKAWLNSLFCPICKSPIDIVQGGKAYGCATDYDHYIVSNHLGITTEVVNVYDSKWKYQIIRSKNQNSIKTDIKMFEVDGEKRVKFSFKERKLTFDFDVFDLKIFDANKAIKRIKTLIVFQ